MKLLTPFGIASDHKTRLVRVGKRRAQIDRKLAPLIKLLWQQAVETIACCEGHGFQAAIAASEFGIGTGRPTASIVFASQQDAEKFKRLTKATESLARIGRTRESLDGGSWCWATNFETKDIAAITRYVRRAAQDKQVLSLKRKAGTR